MKKHMKKHVDKTKREQPAPARTRPIETHDLAQVGGGTPHTITVTGGN